MKKVYYIVQVVEKSCTEFCKTLIEQRFEENELEEAIRKMSMLQKLMDEDRCIIELVKWVNDVEDTVLLGI